MYFTFVGGGGVGAWSFKVRILSTTSAHAAYMCEICMHGAPTSISHIRVHCVTVENVFKVQT